jgi:hypothetical protein
MSEDSLGFNFNFDLYTECPLKCAMEQCRAVDEQVGITMTHLAYCWDTNKQCRVDEQVGITMTHLAYGWEGGKQMQIVVYDQRDMPKEMQNMFAGFRGQGMLDKAT